jgi:hypothetical protein
MTTHQWFVVSTLSTEELGVLLGWIKQLEQPALATLETRHTVEQLEDELNTRHLDLYPEIDERQRTTILRLARMVDSAAIEIVPIASSATSNITNILSFSAAQALADSCLCKLRLAGRRGCHDWKKQGRFRCLATDALHTELARAVLPSPLEQHVGVEPMAQR